MGLLRSRVLKQTGQLYVAKLVALSAGFLISILNTRSLAPAGYGIYSLCFAVWEFVELFVNFGFYSSAARVIALNQHSKEKQRETIGTLLVVALGLATLAAVILFCLSFVVAQLFDMGGEETLRLFAILFGLMTLQTMLEAVCRGSNRIVLLATFEVVSRVSCVALIGLFVLFGKYNIRVAVFLSLASAVGAAIVIVSSFAPKLQIQAATLRALFEDVKTYGFKAYCGDVAMNASYRTDAILISYFVGATAVGFYRLSSLLTVPMTTLSQSLSVTLFTRFTADREIKRRVLLVNSLWLGTCGVTLILLARLIVVNIFGLKYAPVVPLVFPMVLVAACGGLSQPYNMFLGAKGKGNYLRNIAFMLTGINLVLNLVLIRQFGILGACYASLIALVVNLALHYYYYQRTIDHAVSYETPIGPVSSDELGIVE